MEDAEANVRFGDGKVSNESDGHAIEEEEKSSFQVLREWNDVAVFPLPGKAQGQRESCKADEQRSAEEYVPSPEGREEVHLEIAKEHEIKEGVVQKHHDNGATPEGVNLWEPVLSAPLHGFPLPSFIVPEVPVV